MREIQQKIIEALAATPEIDAEAEIERRIAFLVDYAAGIPGVRGFVLGISGGQDSSLGGRLAQLAVERMREAGHEAEFIAMRLPYSVQENMPFTKWKYFYLMRKKSIFVLTEKPLLKTAILK